MSPWNDLSQSNVVSRLNHKFTATIYYKSFFFISGKANSFEFLFRREVNDILNVTQVLRFTSLIFTYASVKGDNGR